MEILKGQMLEIDNLIVFRGKVKANELENIGKEMESRIDALGARRIGNPITATYSVEGDTMDVELLLPIDKKMEDIGGFIYKEKIKIVNALVGRHRGNPNGLQNTCNELNQYIVENKLMPITVAYNVTKKIDPVNIINTEIDVYVGISLNIL